MSDIRRQIEAQIISVMEEAEKQGRDALAAAAQAFPGTPEMVLILAAAELDCRRVEAWWQSMEKTIDGEIVRRALAAPHLLSATEEQP